MLTDHDVIKYYPHSLANWASDGKWKSWEYLKVISKIVAQAVYKGNGRLIITVPVRHGKSEEISKWTPIWYHTNFPENNIILGSYGADFAESWAIKAKNEILTNPKLDLKLNTGVKADASYITNQEGKLYTSGVDGSFTGKGGNLIIIDDPVKNYAEAHSAVYREKTKNWFKSTLYTRLEPGGTIILLMARWHEDDLAGYLIDEHDDDWVLINFTAIAEENDILGRKPGQALCPERYDEKALARIRKAVGPQSWNSLYQQRPTALEGGIIKRRWIRHYDELPHPDIMIQSWDLTFKITISGSFVVGQVWSKTGINMYLVDRFRERIDYPSTKQAITNMANKYPRANKIIIEEKANGAAVISELKTTIPGIVAYSSKESKESRANAVSPLFESGNVWLPKPENMPWINDYIDELCTFPNAANDDQIDATSQALLDLKNAMAFDEIEVYEGMTTQGF